MLPFRKQKKQDSGIATVYRAPDEGKEEQGETDLSGVEAAMEDFCRAKDAKDYKGMARALKDAFEILDAQPHVEADHSNE